MSIATCDKTGQPSIRVVFLRDYDERGFVFYTNYLSAKGYDLSENNKICANFFWPELERQIKIEGIVEKISEKESKEYFDTRPKESQIGAWASEQSSVIKNREVLEDRVALFTEKYKNSEVEKPEYWGGYLIKAHLIEFWQGRENRLHDRFQFTLMDGNWQIDRLAP
jgi:pyridoxamine 5'-phosphate oxidase